jgi:hypothetical protein
MGQGQLGHIKTNTLFDITKLMLKRIMSDNAVNTRFPRGTPMGGSRFRAQFTTSYSKTANTRRIYKVNANDLREA